MIRTLRMALDIWMGMLLGRRMAFQEVRCDVKPQQRRR